MGEPGPGVAGGRSWCLRRLGMNSEWLWLEAGREVTIGRGFGVTYQLVSKVCPLMISRNHCVLKQNPEGQWTIMDNKVIELHHKKQKSSNPSASQSSLELFKVTMSRIVTLKTQMHEKQTAVLNVKKQTRKGNAQKIVKMEKELQDLQSQLCAAQAQQQARVEQLERTFQEEEQHFQGLEKEQGEEDLKQQLTQALQEHRALMEELSQSKKDFEKIIQAKNKELEQTKEEKEKVQAQKEEVLNHMNDVLENELQCIICSEYFIEAVTLNCAHSFCSFCISEWIKRRGECPICRKDIESKTRSLVLDNCINKMVDNLSSDVKERRSALIRERKAKRLS